MGPCDNNLCNNADKFASAASLMDSTSVKLFIYNETGLVLRSCCTSKTNIVFIILIEFSNYLVMRFEMIERRTRQHLIYRINKKIQRIHWVYIRKKKKRLINF